MDGLDPRTGLELLDEHEAWRLVERVSVGRLAVAVAGLPDVFPVNYAVDDRTIVVQTAPGTKLAAAVLGRGVAFEVDALDHEGHAGWSVVIHGQAHEIEKLDEVIAAQNLQIEQWVPSDKGRYLRIVPDDITGRRVPDLEP